MAHYLLVTFIILMVLCISLRYIMAPGQHFNRDCDHVIRHGDKDSTLVPEAGGNFFRRALPYVSCRVPLGSTCNSTLPYTHCMSGMVARVAVMCTCTMVPKLTCPSGRLPFHHTHDRNAQVAACKSSWSDSKVYCKMLTPSPQRHDPVLLALASWMFRAKCLTKHP
jgi:hypothetical protein